MPESGCRKLCEYRRIGWKDYFFHFTLLIKNNHINKTWNPDTHEMQSLTKRIKLVNSKLSKYKNFTKSFAKYIWGSRELLIVKAEYTS